MVKDAARLSDLESRVESLISADDVSSFKELLSHNHKKYFSLSLLKQALANDAVSIAKVLYSAADGIDTGDSLLLSAVANGAVRAMNLVMSKAPRASLDRNRHLALMDASRRGTANIVEALIPVSRPASKVDALMDAVVSNHVNCIALLAPCTKCEEVVRRLAKEGHTEGLPILNSFIEKDNLMKKHLSETDALRPSSKGL